MNPFSFTRRRIVVGLATGLLALGVAGSVLAAPPTPTPTPDGSGQPGLGCRQALFGNQTGQPGLPGWGMPMAGMMAGAGMQGFLQDIANLLGLTPETLQTQLQSGKSLAAIAQEKGVSTDKLAATMLASMQAHMDAQVKSGVLTQQQADQMLQTMKTQITTMIQSTGGTGTGMMGGGMHGGFGTGMMGGATPGGGGWGMMRGQR